MYNFCVVKIIQGGAVAAPTAGKILSEVLPYLEIKKQEEEKENVIIPNIVGMTVKEATKVLEDSKLNIKLNIENSNEIDKTKVIIKEQTPKQGITSKAGGYVMVDIQ